MEYPMEVQAGENRGLVPDGEIAGTCSQQSFQIGDSQ